MMGREDGLLLYTCRGGNVSDFHAEIRCLLRGGGGGLILDEEGIVKFLVDGECE